jgi:hypothetical protein
MLPNQKEALLLKKLNTLSELYKEIENTYLESRYVKYLKLIKANIEFAKISIDQLLKSLNDFYGKDNPKYYTEINYHVFSLIAMHNHFRDYLYKGSEKVFLKKEIYEPLHKKIDNWKYQPEIILMTELRHRIQHAGKIDISVNIEFNYHTENTERKIQVSKEIWESIYYERLNKKKKEITLPYLENKIYSNKNSVNELLNDYIHQNEILYNEIDIYVNEHFMFQNKELNEKLNKFKTIYKELEELGINPGYKLDD